MFALSRWWLPALMLLSLPVGGIINEGLGIIAGRGRPTSVDVDRVIGHTDAPPFPSGHVAGAVMLYGFLFVVADRLPNRVARVSIKTTSLAIIGTIGFTRMWYGAHWPTDVLGAYLLGALLLLPIVFYLRRATAWSSPARTDESPG